MEGLRALAVALVVAYHAHVPGVRSGFVGVDVFFVISGFLITGLLVREQSERGSISIRRFYARRVRRILPAATLVVLVTIFASYHYLGFLEGDAVAADAKWTAVFMANLHFAALGTSYFGSQAPPSPLLHMWSLGVEEQFYLVWPTALLAIALIGRGRRLRLKLAAFLALAILVSYLWSIIETSTSSTWAYFSPLTRAWELGLGGLVAVAGPLLSRLPLHAARVLSWVGLAGVLLSGFVFSSDTPYPGSAAALPVAMTALTIAGGTAAAGIGAEHLLALRPLQWLGARSYSLYLWHWPLLIIAQEYAARSLPLWQNLLWVLVAIVLAALTYRLVENPVRHARVLALRPLLTIGIGACMIVPAIGIAQWQLLSHG